MKKTSLNKWHTEQGANMAEFGGYEMPLWYSGGARAEHMAVLTGVGVFDTSHMAMLLVSGPDGFELLQRTFTRNLSHAITPRTDGFKPGRCAYGMFLDEKAHVIDDAIVGELKPGVCFVVVNAGMGETVSTHLLAHTHGLKANVEDLTDQLGKIDVQGPKAGLLMSKILKDPAEVFGGLGYFMFKGGFRENGAVLLADGTPVLLSRTGYTGEFGFEIYVDAVKSENVWRMIMEAGEEFGALPCGLAARDSLRAGAMLPLSHQDIGAWPFINNPWTFALPMNEDGSGFTKEFIGRRALESVEQPQYTYAFAGFDLRKASMHPDPAAVLDGAGDTIGVVTTCATDMGMGRHDRRLYSVASGDKPEGVKLKGISCGFIKVAKPLEAGDVVTIKDAKRELKVEVVDDIRPGRTARRAIASML